MLDQKPITVEWYDDRWYKRIKKDGSVDYYPSVTTKLGVIEKPFLAKWRGDIGNREADLRIYEAQERGSRIHNAWWIMNQGGAVIYQPFKRPNFLEADIETLKLEHNGQIALLRNQDEMYDIWKLKQFRDIVKPDIVASELAVYSDTHRDAGMIDNAMVIKEGEYPINGKKPLHLSGGLYIADLKTGSSSDDNHQMQTAAYANAYEETYGVEVNGTMIIHTGSKTRTGIPGLGIYPRTRDEWKQDFKNFRSISSVWEIKHKDDRPDVFDIPALIKA